MTRPQATLPAEHERVVALIQLMKQEQQLLVAADADALAELTPGKVVLVQELVQLSRQRHATLGGIGFEAGEAGMEAWVASHADAATRTQWSGLLTAAAEAKELNRVNGLLINRQLAHNQTVLQALRTPAGAAESPLYGAKGLSFGAGAGRRFVSV